MFVPGNTLHVEGYWLAEKHKQTNHKGYMCQRI